MFSLAKIKNKKSFFLPIILLSAFGSQCYGMEDILKGLGSKDNPFHFTYTKPDKSPKETSFLWEAGKVIGPVIAGAVINYALQKWNEDPEMNALIKEDKEIELKIKRHPDYVNIHLLQQHSAAQEKNNYNKEKQLKLNIDEAQLIQHHQEEFAKFLHCDTTMLTQSYCDYMANMHQLALEKIAKQTIS